MKHEAREAAAVLAELVHRAMTVPNGHHLVFARINVALSDAVTWASKMQRALLENNQAEMQEAATRIHLAAQTAQVLSHSMEKTIAAHRRREPRAR